MGVRDSRGQLAPVAEGRWSLTGALTFDSVPSLWPQGAQLLSGTTPGMALEVDLAGVERVDSAGLALLVGWQGRAQAAGRVLRYASVPERLLAIARISEAESFLTG